MKLLNCGDANVTKDFSNLSQGASGARAFSAVSAHDVRKRLGKARQVMNKIAEAGLENVLIIKPDKLAVAHCFVA